MVRYSFTYPENNTLLVIKRRQKFYYESHNIYSIFRELCHGKDYIVFFFKYIKYIKNKYHNNVFNSSW